MSRTAHHVAFVAGAGRRGRPWRSVTIVGLRYSAACLRRGGRPRPAFVRRRADVYAWARANPRDRWVSVWSTVEERRARQRSRLRLEAVRRTVNAAPYWPAEVMDVPPARHRRGAIWLY